jgi:hypothetical protein
MSRLEGNEKTSTKEIQMNTSSNLLVLGASVADDTKDVLGREPLLLRDWAKLHANELSEIAGS